VPAGCDAVTLQYASFSKRQFGTVFTSSHGLAVALFGFVGLALSITTFFREPFILLLLE
jgi:hypothetical protein